MIDFRSDTVTKPSKEMLDAMFSAPVGDDVFMEDPTVNELEQFAADYFGMEASIYCSSGTQTNEIAINIHVDQGGEVITNEDSHVYKYEGGGIARNSGASVRLIRGNRGRLTLEDVEQWINPDDVHFPVTQLVSLEDTSNRGGGAIYDFEEIKRISEFCRKSRLPIHLDGARLMNAMIENKIDLKEYASQFDSISLCLSKGLGAPVGSVLAGSKEFILKAKRYRKLFGGAMRQVGYLAAAGIYALDNHIERLQEDHANAQTIVKMLEKQPYVKEILPTETNIVIFKLNDSIKDDDFIKKLAAKNIQVIGFGPQTIRMVTHLDFKTEMLNELEEVLGQV